ncbi:non-ribosomal peptide synthetase [Streptomyces sp. E11-3]|uniref:non-ribosomal peptide synthetase n=1 Tax=Streptomyces sp. E11-3 TaxID=3110112 RepID=UPI00397FD01C
MATAAKNPPPAAAGGGPPHPVYPAEPGHLAPPSAERLSARGRECHGLMVRIPRPDDTAEIRRRLAETAWRWPALGEIRLWETAVPEPYEAPAARERARREALRPVGDGRAPLRAVLLRYTDGAADLVLVAERSRVSRTALDAVADLLVYGPGAVRDAAVPARRTGAVRPSASRATADWGLGDARRTGLVSALPLVLPGGPGANGRWLLAAVALTLARYSGDPTVAVGRFDATHDAPRAEVVRMADVVDVEAPAGLLARLDAVAPVEAGAELPAVGVVLGPAADDRTYVPCQTPLFPLTVLSTERPDGTFTGSCWFDEGVVAPRVAGLFCASVERLAARFAQEDAQVPHSQDPHSQVPLSQVPFIGTEETERILRLGQGAQRAAPARRIDELFAEVARRRPDAVALVDDTGELTYRQLDERAERIAAGLRALGIARGSRVGVFLDRDASLVVSLLGVLKAGGAYVPMDVNYPADRLRYIAASAQLPLVIGGAAEFPAVPGVRVVRPDELTAADDAEGTADAGAAAASADDDAYVIYTSGSTGRPKGVVVPHRNVAALLDATSTDFGLGPDDVWTLFHSSAFDFSVWEIWGCLLTGGRLVVVSYWVARDTHAFYRLLAEHGVTVLNQTPSAFAQLMRTDQQERGDMPVRLLVFGGEPLDVAVLGPWFARHSPSRCRVVNMFGITETTVHVTARTLTPADVVAGSRSVGRALPGWSVSVRDAQGRVLPPGAAGEIYVGGAGVADRYLGQAELTAQRFIVDQDTGVRLYRSGDKGRLHPDGSLDHLGRLDSQVKIRGHRIELGEIRSVLMDDPGVSAAVVVVNEAIPGDPASSRIDAYVVPALSAPGPVAPRVLDNARRILPDYMTPATLTEIAAVPLTDNGKPDLTRLPPPTAAERTPGEPRPVSGPSGGLADDILDIWSHCLKSEVTVEDNFFERGGNSLLVVRVLAEMRERGLPQVTPRDFYAHSTAGQFIGLVEERTS